VAVIKPLIWVQYIENWETFIMSLYIFSAAIVIQWLQRLSLKNRDIFWRVPEIRSKPFMKFLGKNLQFPVCMF